MIRMNTASKISPGQFQLKLEFALHYLGWAKSILLMALLLAATGWWVGVPYMQRQIYQLEERKLSLQANRQQLIQEKKEPPLDDNLVRLNAFHEMLGEKKHVEQQVKTILSLANESGINLKAGEYQLSENSAGKYFSYRVQLPVKASYSQIRKFTEQVLLAIPYASLDEMSFKREAVSGVAVDSKLVFTIYLSAGDNAKGGFE